MNYFELILLVATLHGNATVPVGLQYDSIQSCERDFKRASGVLERIMDNRYGDGTSHVYDHTCKQTVNN